MRFQLGIQVLLLIIAAAIAFGVIKPKFEDIRVDQNEIASYRSAIENIDQYNQTLQTLLNDYNSLPASDREALSRYLPESIEVAGVSRDISNIVDLNRLLLLDISFGVATPVTTTINEGVVVDPYMAESFSNESTGLVGDVSGVAPSGLYSQSFEVSVVGTYDQMKEMLKDFEQNDYPLRLLSLSFSLDDSSSGLIQYSFTLETYALPAS